MTSLDRGRRSLIIGASATAAVACTTGFAAADGHLAPEFVGIEGWLNSGPLSMRALRGRPVLVTFWARSCFNCINAMPAIKSWHAKYARHGLVVVGVHTPEFPIEKSRPALEAAIARFDLRYPVAEDNASATWNAWGNQYWPAEYLVDKRGYVVHSHFGEGAYLETERLIQQSL